MGTARLGETFLQFLRRAVPGQFGRALSFERQRLQTRSRFTRLVGNRVYQGLVVEVLLTALFFVAFGARGGALFLLQAMVVSVLLARSVGRPEQGTLDAVTTVTSSTGETAVTPSPAMTAEPMPLPVQLSAVLPRPRIAPSLAGRS